MPKLLLLVGLALLAVGCAGVSQATPTAVETMPVQPTPQADFTATPAATQTEAVSTHLILWAPPQFDPALQSQAGALLSARLKEFEAQNPGVTVEVRIKAPSGPGGLLDALSAVQAAAPLAAPSVVMLSRSDMEAAALKGLIQPVDRLQSAIDDTDWFPFARQMTNLDGVPYGLPFSGDVLLLVYRPAQLEDLLKADAGVEGVLAWKTLAANSYVVIFPAAHTQSFITLALYRSLDGTVLDANGRPMLDEALLQQIYETYSQGVLAGAFPPWITALENDSQAWQAFLEGRGHLLITWSSSYLQNLPADTVAAPFYGMQSQAFSLADGWVLSVSDPFPQRQELSEQLVLFLTQSDFVSDWSEAVGVLPARPSALAAWRNQTLVSVMNQAALSAQLRPDMMVLNSLSQALHSSDLDVLKQKVVPSDAALQAAQRLDIPGE